MTTPEDRVLEALPECDYLGIDYNGTPLAPCGRCPSCTARAMAEVVKAAREWAQAGPSDEDRADTALMDALQALDTPETSEIGSEG